MAARERRAVDVDAGGRRIRVRHYDQRWWPEQGIRKIDVVDYYRAVAHVLLPHLRDRPFTMRRHYNGPRSPFEWIKDAPPELPDWIRTTEQPAKSRAGRTVRYLLVNDEAALLWMTDFGCIDLHVWASRVDRPDRPDFVLFDLDPADVAFEHVAAAALLLRRTLEALELESLVNTTGGDGLHVRVPVARVHSHAEARSFAEIVAGALVRASDGVVTTQRSLARRRGVYVDTKMNGHGQQVVAPYSVRPLPGAPVATPLRWEEVVDALEPAVFTPAVVRGRVERHGDLHAGARGSRQKLSAALARLAG